MGFFSGGPPVVSHVTPGQGHAGAPGRAHKNWRQTERLVVHGNEISWDFQMQQISWVRIKKQISWVVCSGKPTSSVVSSTFVPSSLPTLSVAEVDDSQKKKKVAEGD